MNKIKKIFYSKKFSSFTFVFPNILLYVLFFVIPFTIGIYYSLTNFDGLKQMDFIGLANYTKIFSDPTFYKVFLQTVLYTAVSVPLTIIISLLIAVLLNVKFLKFKTIPRAIIYFPALLSTVMIGITWRWIFGEESGLINEILKMNGFEIIRWTTDKNYAFITVIVATMWRIGTYILLYLGGLQTIPQTYYEAAKIDGANDFKSFINITVPLLKPSTYMVLTLALLNTFKEYALVKSLTGGGPGYDTTYLVQYIYNTGFEKRQIGYASAVSIVLFIVLLIVSLLREKFRDNMEVM